MSENSNRDNMRKERDIMDLSSSPKETGNKPERPVASPDTGRFFLDQFLDDGENAPAEDAPAQPQQPGVQMAKNAPSTEWPEGVEEGDIKGAIIARLRGIYDPEIPVNIYEMGLIYEVNLDEFNIEEIKMTLTTPHCPVAETMPGEVELQAGSVPGVKGVDVKLVWEPPWDMSRMSDEARLELGLL